LVEILIAEFHERPKRTEYDKDCLSLECLKKKAIKKLQDPVVSVSKNYALISKHPYN